MNPDQILQKIAVAVDILIDAGEPHEGLFPSLLDLQNGEMLPELPPTIPGQRNGDRSHPGSNLIHDEALLRTMYALAEGLDRPRYAQAADAYIQRFATHCTGTETGLFPWGEHAFWNLVEDGVGDSHRLREPEWKGCAIHDHLRQAPVWLWEKLHSFNPACVESFGRGLDYHYKKGEPLEYTRHAQIEVKARNGRGLRSCDFPRHGGFYILDWAFAYNRTEREDFAGQIRRMVDYWWPLRDDTGNLLIESRTPEGERFHNVNAPSQTLSLGVSLLESLPLLEGKKESLRSVMRERALKYIDAFFHAPHRPEEGVFVILYHRYDEDDVRPMPIWSSRYGLWPVCYIAVLCLCGYRLTEDRRLLQWAETAGRHYLSTPFPNEDQAPAMDAGMALGLLADLYDITGREQWRDGAMRLAEQLNDIYFDTALPRGASGIDWYESQMGPSFLLHGLARLALLFRDREACPLEPDYTGR